MQSQRQKAALYRYRQMRERPPTFRSMFLRTLARAVILAAFTAIAFQMAKDRGEIPQETDIKLLMDFLYGYSLFRLITGQLDDDQLPDRIGDTIARIARSGISSFARTEKRRNVRT